MKRPGRPPKLKKQERHIGFFVTNREWLIIEQKVHKAGVNISDFMRQAAIYADVRMRWQPEERLIFKQLVEMSTDLHELTRLARRGEMWQAAMEFERYRKMIDEVIRKMEEAEFDR